MAESNGARPKRKAGRPKKLDSDSWIFAHGSASGDHTPITAVPLDRSALPLEIERLSQRIAELELAQGLQERAEKTVENEHCSLPRMRMADSGDAKATLAQLLADSDLDDETRPDFSPGSTTSIKRGKGITSGYSKKAQFNLKKEEFWPHAFLNSEYNPDTLNLELFLLGYSRILSILCDCGDMETVKLRIAHLQEVMKVASVHGFPIARDFHYRCLREIEIGILTWADHVRMEVHSMQAVKDALATGQNGNQGNINSDTHKSVDKFKHIFCQSFNFHNDCKFAADDKQCRKLHACVLCGEKGYLQYHKGAQCRKNRPKPEL